MSLLRRPFLFAYVVISFYQIQEVAIMRKGLTEIIFILDRSGSMSGLESDTIGGFNSLIEK